MNVQRTLSPGIDYHYLLQESDDSLCDSFGPSIQQSFLHLEQENQRLKAENQRLQQQLKLASQETACSKADLRQVQATAQTQHQELLKEVQHLQQQLANAQKKYTAVKRRLPAKSRARAESRATEPRPLRGSGERVKSGTRTLQNSPQPSHYTGLSQSIVQLEKDQAELAYLLQSQGPALSKQSSSTIRAALQRSTGRLLSLRTLQEKLIREQVTAEPI